MYYTHKILLSFLVVAILGEVQLVATGWIGQRTNILKGLLVKQDRSSETVTVDLPDFGILTKYVCPNTANFFRRQTTPGTITIPKSQLRTLLAKLRAVEISLLDIIDSLLAADELDSTSSSALAAETHMTRVHVTVTALQTMTMTRTRTRSITVPSIVGKTSLAVLSTAKSTGKVVQISKPQEAYKDSTIKSTAIIKLAKETSESKAQPPTATASVILTKYPITNTTGYKFNAQSSSNVAVYFGQTPKTGSTTLLAQCADPNIDIVILAFVISQLSGGLYPTINFGAACGGQTPAQISQAPGLLNCPDLAGYIKACQETYGKKVFLSIGGATSQLAFTNTAQANAFGDVLWNLFGPPGNVDTALRPFGTVAIDGFDIDNENNHPAHYADLARTLRTRFSSPPAANKTYYLSSAPQCPFPDASNPLPMLLLCDFVWVQFYNNPGCEIGSPGFEASVRQWSNALLPGRSRLLVGAPGFRDAGPAAWQGLGGVEGVRDVLGRVRGWGLLNLGGAMFWDGAEGRGVLEGGRDVFGWAKVGLGNS